MSELKFSCPHCSQHIACGPEWAGMQTKCPSCQNDIVIPKPPPAVAAPPQPPPPPKPQATPLRVSTPAAHGGSSHSTPPPPPPPPPPARSSTGGSSLSVARPAAQPPPQHEPAAASAHADGAPPGGPSIYPGDNPAMQWAGLVGAFIVTGVIIAMAVAWQPPQDTPYMLAMKAKEAAERGASTPDEDEEEDSGGLTNAAAAAVAATPQWGLSLQTAQIPQAAASGNFDGRPFAPERAYLQRTGTGYLLTVRQGTGFQAERELMIALPLKPGEQLDGQAWAIAPDTTPAPRIVKRWLQNARQQTRMFTNGYAMKLEFDQTANNQIPTRLFISLPDDDKTFVAGTMTASFLIAGTPGQQQRRQ